jgi:hypothetical protein
LFLLGLFREIPAEYQLNPSVTLYKLAGVKKIALWYEDTAFPTAVKEGILPFLEYNGIDVYLVPVLSFNPSQDKMNKLAMDLRDMKPDAIIGAGSTPTCSTWYKALRNANYVPNAMVESNCITEPSTKTDTPDAIYSLDKTEFDYRMTGLSWTDDLWYPPINGVASAKLVWEDISNRFNSIPHWSIPLIASVGLVYQKAIERAGTLDTDAIRIQINQFNEPSFVGQIGFSSWGQISVKDVILVQADQNFDLQIVYPLGSATSTLIYPAPTFEERIFNAKYLSERSERVLAGFSAFFILISIALIVFTLVNRNDRFIMAASPLFLCAILVGSIMLYSAFYMWVLHAYSALCYLRFWLIGLGFVTMFGALFSKTWRVMKIFTTSDLTVFRVTNAQLALVMAVLLGIEAILLAIWSGTSRPRQLVTVADPIRPSKNTLVCSNGKSGTPMLAILVTYKLAMVFYGIYMSFRIWKIPLKQFNESRPIAFSMYNMLCFGILAFGLQVSGSISDPAMFIVRSVCLILSTFFTILAIFGPKIAQVMTGRSGFSTNGTSRGGTTTTTASHRSNASTVQLTSIPPSAEPEETDVIVDWQKKYKKLRKRYLTLKRSIPADGKDESLP